MAASSKLRYIFFGSLAFVLFGMTLAVIGGRLIVYQHILTKHGETIIGEIIKTGRTHRSTGGYVNFIHYQFRDAAGTLHTGQSSGYTGEVGEDILLEYAPAFPFIHRVAGEGRNKGYAWRWAILGFGLLLTAAGIHWFVNTRGRIRLGERLRYSGIKITGTVQRITDQGRTITYAYKTDAGECTGKTLALPAEIVQGFSSGDSIEVLCDPSNPRRSVLKIEL